MPISEIVQAADQAECQIAIVSAPSTFDDILEHLPEGARTIPLEDGPDLILFFTKNSREAEEVLPGVMAKTGEATILWWAYPKLAAKTGSDLSRDICWEMARRLGLDAVSQLALDGTRTALRLKKAQSISPHARK